jgi:hypothetical protein
MSAQPKGICADLSTNQRLASRKVRLFRSVFVDKLPGKTPGAIILVEFNRDDHFCSAILAVSSVFVGSVQKDFVKQLQDS